MPYVTVPKDLSKIKTKVAFNLSKRQLLCFSLAGLVGIPLYLLSRGALGNSLAMILLIVATLPIFLLALYERDGLPAEKVLKNIIVMRYIRPAARPYKTTNLYTLLAKECDEANRKNDKTKARGRKKQALGTGYHPVPSDVP